MRWFRPPYAATFRAACEWHDFMYHVGGGKADKLRADRGLFKGMVKRAMQVGKTPLQAWWMVCVALCYYGAVRAFGKRSFQWEDKRG